MGRKTNLKKGKEMAKKNQNQAAVTIIEGVNIPVETQEAQAEDAANEQAEQHEKAVEAALETAVKFVESTAQFNAWLNSNPSINNEAYSRAQADAIKRVTQDVDAEASELRAKLAQLEAQKAKAASQFGLPVAATPAATKGKRGRKPKAAGSDSTMPNDSDIIAAVVRLTPASVEALASELNVVNTKALAVRLKALREQNKIDVMGQRRGMKYVSR